MAAWNNHVQAIHALKYLGANIEALNIVGNTPSDLARQKQYEDVITALQASQKTLRP